MSDRDRTADGVLQLVLALADYAWENSGGQEGQHLLTRHLVDTIGCAVAGSREPSAVIARTAALGRGGEATLFFGGEKVSVDWAAFANGVMARCLDLNDNYFSAYAGGHPSDYIPAVLAAAERTRQSGRNTLRAIAVCYQVFCQLCDAAGLAYGNFDYVVHGSVATSLAVARLDRLDDRQIGHAVSLALVSSVALAESRFGDVSLWKNCASANSARGGVLAAELAEVGMTGPPRPFSGRSGFINAVAPDFDQILLQVPPSGLVLSRCSLKRYPAGFLAQSAIDAALDVRRRLVSAALIRRVEVKTCSYAFNVMAGDPAKWSPQNRETADHSIPFLVASALTYGSVDASTYGSDRFSDESLLRVLDILKVVDDDECNDLWPAHARSDVTVTMEDGTVVVGQALDYRGHFRTPMTDEDISDKFIANCAGVLSEQEAAKLLDSLWAFSSCTDVGDLLLPLVRG